MLLTELCCLCMPILRSIGSRDCFCCFSWQAKINKSKVYTIVLKISIKWNILEVTALNYPSQIPQCKKENGDVINKYIELIQQYTSILD